MFHLLRLYYTYTLVYFNPELPDDTWLWETPDGSKSFGFEEPDKSYSLCLTGPVSIAQGFEVGYFSTPNRNILI